MKMDKILVTLLTLALALMFLSGAAVGTYVSRPVDVPAPSCSIVADVVNVRGVLVRAEVIDPGTCSQLADLLSVLEGGQAVMQFTDPAAALLVPGDRFIAWCAVGVEAGASIDRCELLPIVKSAP